ncbi:hypothetical protein [Streptomyces venezuelae]|uniref:hypothetical protein n=1 Tax=Streptomyces venezuelae TaxID=54571 RepID=UPI0036656FC6
MLLKPPGDPPPCLGHLSRGNLLQARIRHGRGGLHVTSVGERPGRLDISDLDLVHVQQGRAPGVAHDQRWARVEGVAVDRRRVQAEPAGALAQARIVGQLPGQGLDRIQDTVAEFGAASAYAVGQVNIDGHWEACSLRRA